MAHIIGHAIKASDTQTVVNALRVAARVYRDDANESAGHARLVAQFIKQAEEAEALATDLESRDVVRILASEIV